MYGMNDVRISTIPRGKALESLASNNKQKTPDGLKSANIVAFSSKYRIRVGHLP